MTNSHRNHSYSKCVIGVSWNSVVLKSTWILRDSNLWSPQADIASFDGLHSQDTKPVYPTAHSETKSHEWGHKICVVKDLREVLKTKASVCDNMKYNKDLSIRICFLRNKWKKNCSSKNKMKMWITTTAWKQWGPGLGALFNCSRSPNLI